MPSRRAVMQMIILTVATQFVLNFAASVSPQVRRLIKPNGLGAVRNAA